MLFPHSSAALTPPMGWNSYDYYDTTVTEADVRANAEVLARELKPYGWEYVVVDIQWYAKDAGARRAEFQYIPFGDHAMDEYGRFQPDPARFPSAAGGRGFGPLADYVHSLGLKFGIHIMRGIPRAAAHRCPCTARPTRPPTWPTRPASAAGTPTCAACAPGTPGRRRITTT